jgi:hypothetical protein
MTNAGWLVWVGTALGLASCGTNGLDVGFGVATTVVLDSSVADATLPRISSLQIDVTGDETYSAVEPLAHGATRTERFIYRPLPSSRSLIMAIAALAEDGTVLASGESGVITLTRSAGAQVGIVLHGGDMFDGGLPIFDGSMQSDGSVDLGPPPDLVTYDASGGQSRCASLAGDTSVILCQGFESQSEIPTGANGTITSNGTYAIDTTRHFRGVSSLHLTTEAQPSSESDVLVTYPISPPAGEIHARVFVFPHGTLAQTTALISFTGMYESTEVGLRLTSNGALSTVLAADGQDLSTSGPVSTTSATKLPFDAWTCLELVGVPSEGSTGKIQVFMNEKHLTDLDYSGATESASTFWGAQLSLALDSTPGQMFDVWFDELVVGTSQLGCEL